jgi:excisionase family DNA binding protein
MHQFGSAQRVTGLLTPREVAELLQTTERHLERLVQAGRLRCVKVGRFVRFDPRDVSAFIEASKIGAAS